MSLDSLRRKICDLAYSEDISDSLRFHLLRFLTRREMDFLEFEDFPNMKAYLQRLKNLFVQYEMYDGYLSEEAKCEAILAPLIGGFLLPGDAIIHDPVRNGRMITLMAELLFIEEVKKTERANEAEEVVEPSASQIPQEGNERQRTDEGSTTGEGELLSGNWGIRPQSPIARKLVILTGSDQASSRVRKTVTNEASFSL